MTHLIPLSEEQRISITRTTSETSSAQHMEEVHSYPQFVENLCREMNTPVDTAVHAGMGVAGEAGEVIDLIKKTWAYDRPWDTDKLIEELGDLRFYYQKLLNMLLLTDSDIQGQNMRKLAKRYPDGLFTSHHANARLDKQPNGENENGKDT